MMKIDHHRGPVTSVQVCQASDVLVSSSHDATICLWSLENFTLLNLIQMNSPVMNIRISSDSVSVFAVLYYYCVQYLTIKISKQYFNETGNVNGVIDIVLTSLKGMANL